MAAKRLGQVDVEHSLQLVGARFEKGRTLTGPRIVDQDIGGAEPVDAGLQQRSDIVRRGEIGGDDFGLSTVKLCQALTLASQGITPATDQREICTQARQFFRDSSAYPAAAASHNGMRAAKRLWVRLGR